MQNSLIMLLGSESLTDEAVSFTENAIGAFMMDPVAVKDLVKEIL